MKFKTASRSPEELKTAKQTLNEMIVDVVRGPNGRYNPKGVMKLAENRFEIAELIVQLIQDEVSTSDPLPFLVEEVEGDIKNQYIWQQMTSALKVVSRAYGSKPLSQRLTFKEFSMSTSHKELAVELPLEEIASGRTTPSIVAEQMAFAVNRYRISNVLDTLDAAITVVADRTAKAGYVLRYVGLTKGNLDKAIDGLADESDTPTIMGRHIALFPAIESFGGWSQETLRDFETRGQIGKYRGANIVQLVDGYAKVVGTHVLRNDRVYIAGAAKGAKFMTKDVSFLNYANVDERTATFNTGIRLEDGLLVWDPYRYRIIEA
jgi:hypothetical protein